MSSMSLRVAADKEYLIIDTNYLERVMSKFACGNCFGSVNVSFAQKDLDCGVDVECEECSSTKISEVTGNPVTK